MKTTAHISRRQLIGAVASATIASAVSLRSPRRALAGRRTLRIMQWRHFIPDFDPWFHEKFAKEWGEANDTDVVIDNVGFGEISSRAQAEVEVQEGHDLIQFVTPHAMHCEHLIDHAKIFQECLGRYGEPETFAIRANYNARTKTYLGFSPSYQPAFAVFRGDLWKQVGKVPDRWSDVLGGARQIKLLLDARAGMSLAPEHNGEQTLRAIMYSFGAAEQDGDGRPSLASPSMREALDYVKSLYEQAMEADVLTWDGASNNRFMLSGEGSFTIDSLSILRASESMDLASQRGLQLGRIPAGPAARLGSFGFYNYAIWKFAENIDGAKQFLIDYVGRSRDSFLASRFQNMPCYPATISDLSELTDADGATAPYRLMKEVPGWTTNVGHLGGTNPAVSEIYARGTVARMFAGVATGRVSADDAMVAAQAEAGSICGRWAERGWM